MHIVQNICVMEYPAQSRTGVSIVHSRECFTLPSMIQTVQHVGYPPARHSRQMQLSTNSVRECCLTIMMMSPIFFYQNAAGNLCLGYHVYTFRGCNRVYFNWGSAFVNERMAKALLQYHVEISQDPLQLQPRGSKAGDTPSPPSAEQANRSGTILHLSELLIKRTYLRVPSVMILPGLLAHWFSRLQDMK